MPPSAGYGTYLCKKVVVSAPLRGDEKAPLNQLIARPAVDSLFELASVPEQLTIRRLR